MLTLAELRARLGAAAQGIDDNELYDIASAAYAPLYSDPAKLRATLMPDAGKWSSRVGASIDSYQGNAYGLAEAVTGADWAREGRQRNEADASFGRRMATEHGAIDSFRDIGSREGYVSDGLDYLGGLAVDSAPYLGEAVAGGLIGRGLAVGARAAGSAAREMGMVAAERGAASQVGRAGLAGGVVASYPSAVGDVLSAQREQSGGQMDLLSAAALGVPYAGLNALGIEGALSRGGLTRNIMHGLDEAGGFAGGAKRMGTSMAVTAGQEGASETGQEFLNQVGRNAVDQNAGYFGDEALARYGESFVGGAALGGLFGGVGGARRSQDWQYRQQDLVRAEAERTAAAQAEMERAQNAPPLQVGYDPQAYVVFPDGTTATTPEQELMARFGMSAEELARMRGQPIPVPAPGATPNAELAPPTPAKSELLTDPRGDAAIGANPPARARSLAAQLYKLVDDGKATEEDIDPYLDGLGAQRRRYGPIEDFVKERASAAPRVQGSAPVAVGAGDAPGAQPGGSVGNPGGVAVDQGGALRPPAGAPVAGGAAPVPVGSVAPGGAPDAVGPVTTVDPVTGIKKTVAPYVEPTKQGPATVENPEQVEFRRGFASKLTGLPVEDRTILERWLGVAVNDEGDLTLADESASLTEIGKTLVATRGRNIGKAGVTKEAARKRVMAALKAAGAPEGLEPRQLYEKLGFQLSELDLEAMDRMTADFVPEAGAPGKVSATVDTGLDAADDGATANMTLESEDTPESYAEDDTGAAEEAAEDHSDEQVDSWVKALDTDVQEGRVTQDDMHEASYAVDMASGPRPWGRLTNDHKAAAVRAYARARAANDSAIEKVREIAYGHRQEAGRSGSQADAGAGDRASAGAASPGLDNGADAVAAEATGNRPQVQRTGSAPVVVKKAPKVHRVVGKAAPAKETAAEAAPGPLATPKESWGTLATATPGMPAWGDLNASQQARWTDMVHRGVDNLAAAARISGENPTLKSASPAGTGLRTAVTRDEFGQQPGAKEAFADLEALGIGHATDWVDTWVVGTESTYHMRGKQQVVEILPAGSVDLNGDTRTVDDVQFDVAHEIGHAVDIASNGSVYSSQPELEFMSFGGDIRPVGDIAVELENAMQESRALKALLEYPYDQTKFPEVDTPKRAQQELFAQLFGMYANPLGRKHLARHAPLAHQFMKDAVDDLKQTQVDPGHSRGTAIRRGAGFLARGPAAQERDAQAAGGVLGSGEAGAGGKLRSRSSQALEGLKTEQAAAAKIHAALPPKAQDAAVNIRDWFKKHSPWVLTSFQLAQEFGSEMAGLLKYVALADAAKKERTRLQMEFHDTSVLWDKLPTAIKTRLNGLMQRATLAQAHPDLDFEHKDNKHLRRATPEQDRAMRAVHAKLAAEYEALGAPARAVYQRAKKVLQDSWDTRAKAYETIISDTYHDQLVEALEAGDAERHNEVEQAMLAAQAEYKNQMSALKGPYFPLMRFGDYLAIGESSDYTAMQAAWKKSEGDERKELGKKMDALKRDGKHYVVSAHETRAGAERAIKDYEKQGLVARTAMAGLKLDNLRSATRDTVKHMEAAVAERLGDKLAQPAIDALHEVFLRGLPEMHALRREAARKGIEGASVDMLRAFSAAGQSNAFYTSRLMYAKDMTDAMFAMKAETKGNTDLTHVQREMEKRMALDMKFTETPVQDAASSITWAFQLGVSPAYVLINSMQPFLVTAPVLAGKFGLGAATREVTRAARDALRVLKDARFKDGKWDWWSGISEESIPGPSRNEDRAAIRVLLERGILDEGMHHELNMFAQDGSRWVAKMNRFMSWATQQVEVTNRMTTALAAFRLARKNGMAEAEATDYAYKVVNGTQFDYSPEGSARIMREGGGVPLAKLVFQFRRYQQNMLYLLGSNIRKSFGDGQDAKDARASLVYLTLATGMSAGVMGLPFMGLALGVANALRDDDDDEGDAATALRNALFDLTGDRELATVLAKGLPAMFGADLSKRIGLSDVAHPMPFARLDRAETGRDKAAEIAFNLFGPSAGLAANIWEGVGLMGHGDFVKGIEKLVPKFAADAVKAGRFATKGFTDSRGDEILGADELNAWNIFTRSIGFATTKESNYYEGTSAKMKVKEAVEDRKGRIGNQFKVALREGGMADVRELIREYNTDHPDAKILPKDEVRWRKDALKSQKQRDGSGIKLDPKRDKDYEQVMRFAR